MEIWEPIKYLKFFAGKSFHEMIDDNEELLIYVKKQIKDHRETINYDSEPRDYIDAFLIEQKKHNPNLEDKNGEWSDMQLIGSCYDLFGAGMETTSTTTHTFIFYMLHYPEIQAKIREEIDRVIGKDKIITMSDQNSLPYFNACLQEAQRIITLMPINPFHETVDDVIIDGYTIPKGTTIVPQFDIVHKDETVFENPQKFDPTRFLDEQNNFKVDDRVMPYSLGKRGCLGKSLAKMELFLFWTTFLQHFEFRPEDPNNLPPFEFDYSLSKNIKPFNVRVIERK
uniref:Cytochrome P450 n=1 Tax=Panagrolaimus davidi TaxID=227884 RepID=A0A914Q7M3_9BILA